MAELIHLFRFHLQTWPLPPPPQGGNANQRKKRAQIALDKAKAEKNGTTSTKKAK
ncbi:hypothetical protein H4Q26_004083, partial [Puccinia striiformis f. sp. tritici PST-130]